MSFGRGVGRRLSATVIGASLSLALIAAGTNAVTADASTRSNLNRALDRIMEVPNGPPGISMQIVKNGKSQYFRRGVANVKTGHRPTLRQRFRIASVAKAFSGAVALNLVAQGRLGLDSTIGQILPGMLPKASRVTLARPSITLAGCPSTSSRRAFSARLPGTRLVSSRRGGSSPG